MCGTPVHGPALDTRVMLVGQAPGAHEARLGRPFAFTAGKTLFKWLGSATGMDEDELRERVYFSAVARCFPGKAKSSGDRVPDAREIENCREFLSAEVRALKPAVVLAVGRLAISETLGPKLFPKGAPLADVVGRSFRVDLHGVATEVIPLPHPSGVSRWPKIEPGKSKLEAALKIFKKRFAAAVD